MASASALPLITKEDWWGRCRKGDVLGKQMSYYDSDPEQRRSEHAVIFLHGNMTSSYLWRNVIPRVEPIARCLALDNIGMGRSDKVDGCSYRFADHYRYFSAWMGSLNLPDKVSIVCHDWGSPMAFHWCNEHRNRILGLVHMESIVATFQGWDEIKKLEGFHDLIKVMRSPAGEDLILEQNAAIEKGLPHAAGRPLRSKELEAYREPYLTPGEGRRPTLTWVRELPIVGDGPDDVIAIVSAYSQWLRGSDNLPKLFISAEPGAMSRSIKTKTGDWSNHKTVEVEGRLLLQETSPFEIGEHIKNFLSGIYI